MHAEDLRRNNCSNREAIEHVDKRLPHLDVTPSFAFVIESVYYKHSVCRAAIGAWSLPLVTFAHS